MIRSCFPYAWRLLLALSLVAGPWPPAAWATLAPATVQVADAAMDCHGRQAAATPAPDAAPCDDDCCRNPGCDPAHCLVIHASIAAPVLGTAHVMRPAAVRGVRHHRFDTGPPLRSLLRPPIA